jgi:hypothetical protein
VRVFVFVRVCICENVCVNVCTSVRVTLCFANTIVILIYVLNHHVLQVVKQTAAAGRRAGLAPGYVGMILCALFELCL